MPSPDDPGNPVTAAATSVGGGTAGGEGGSFGFRDREPAPGYSGEDPETTFATWEKNVRLWEYETDIPRGKRGVKLLRALEGSAKMAVEEMPFEEIACEDGVRNIMQRLKEYYMPHLEVALPRAFEGAVYGPPRPSRESFGEYIAKMDKNFARLRKEGVDLPESAQGYILYRQASLSEFQEQRLLVWADGKYDRNSIVKGLRKLDKVVKEKGKSNYLTNLPEDEAENFAEEHYLIADEEDDDNFIYLQEGDLDEILTGEEVLSALASYQDIRKAVKEQQKGRGYYGNGKGYGKDYGKSKSKGKGKWQRVHREQLKLRTKCWKCDQVGHWSSECENEPKRHGPPSSGTSSSSVSTARSGFYVASGNLDGQVDEKVLFSDQAESCLWLREFVAQRAKNADRPIPESYKAAAPQFCGINTIAAHGVVDTAAEGGLVGTLALQRLQDHLRSFGLCCKWIPKNTAAKGVGGQAKVVGVTLIPLGIGGVNGVLEATVVEGDVPLLLPIRMMKGLRTVIDLDQMKFIMKEYEVTVDMFELPSGHVTVDITSFENGRFQMPVDIPGCQPSDFQDSHGTRSTPCTTIAMVAQFENPKTREDPTHSTRVCQHGAAEESASAWKRPCESADADGRQRVPGREQEEGSTWLASHHGQGVHTSPVFHVPKHCGRLVSTISAIASLAIGGIQGGTEHRGPLCGDHLGGKKLGSPEVADYPSDSCSLLLHSPEEQAEGRWKRSGILHSVPRLSQPLGEPISFSSSTTRTEGAEGKPEEGSLGSTRGDAGGRDEERRTCSGVGGFRRESGPPHAARDEGGEKGPDGDERAVEEGGRAAKDCSSRGSGEAGCFDSEHLGEEGREEGGRERGRTTECCRKCISGSPGASEVQVWRSGRETDRQEGGPPQRNEVLQVHDEGLRLLRVGEEERNSSECAQLLSGGVAGALEEIKESKEDPTTGCGGGGQRWAVMEEKGGSWCEATNTRARRTLRRLQGERMRGVSSRGIQVDPGYEIEDENRGWRRAEGLVPLRSEFPIRVWVELTHRGQAEEIFGEDQTRGFKSKERKKVNKAMEALLSKEEIKKVVAEVFSPPRVVETAERHGLAGGTSFDYETGWDLDRPDHRRSMWKKLKEEEPMMVILCPPCKAFTILQGLNFGKMDLKKSVALVSYGLDSLELAMEIAKWQWRKGRYFLFEHPESARSWEEPSVQEVLRLEGVKKGGCDMCAHGMAVTHEGFNRKPTGIMSNSQRVLREVCLRCPGNHRHVPLIGGLAHKAQRYPEGFCEAIIRGLKRQMKEDGGWMRRGEEGNKVVYVFAEEEEDEDLDLGLEEDEVPMRGEKAEEVRGEEDAALNIGRQEQQAVHKLHTKDLGIPPPEIWSGS